MEKKEVVSELAPATPLSPISPTTAGLPRRLIVCVDGDRYDPRTDKVQTSVHRIYSSVHSGKSAEPGSGLEFNQVPRYFAGISAASDVLSRNTLQAALPGHGYHQQIQDVYDACCELTGERDEVVLFGFARGAYVVRAVAGLLHHFGALASAGTPNFAKDFKKIRKQSDKILPQSPSLARASTISSLSTLSSTDFRLPPKIRFLGVFDTVKAVQDDGIYDISSNSSIVHLRHALALHEDRKALAPECISLEDFSGLGLRLRDTGRSEVQAWFIGNHQDLGGTSAKAGISLYPLQWMITEAHACGVKFDFEGLQHRGSDEKPLSVVFPRQLDGRAAMQSSFTASNGVVSTLHDLRMVHEQPRYEGTYSVRLNTRQASIRAKKPRSPFDSNGHVRGFCDYAPQGTIIHPSVYLLLDEHISVALDTKEAKLQRNLEDWRQRMLGTTNGHVNFGFWGDNVSEDDATDAGAIRVLVCGNTGVGKSTLINKTFGVTVTSSSDRRRGIHEVTQEITFEGRPDLIVHDSGGFEAGADTEFRAIEEFLKAKSEVVDVRERLHVIWFCIEINSARTLQTATEKLFQAVSKYAKEVPIVVVATKKDDLLDLEFSKRRKELKKLGQAFDEDACDQYAAEQLQVRLEQIRDEMESVPGGRLDALVAVSQDDEQSVAQLSKTTSHCFDTDKVRLLYIRAQVTRIDLKVDMALCEVMRRYRILVRRATGVSFSVIGPTAHRKAAADKVCKAILNCFGLPSVSADVVLKALKQNVWSHLPVDLSVAFAEFMNTLGFIGTGAAGGIPAFLVTGALSVPLVVPSTCRLFLTMACDLILTLVRSFKEVTFRASGQPGEKDVQAAARIYRIRGYSQHVHEEIKKLVPRRNVTACYAFDKVQTTMDGFMAEYKDKLMDDVELPMKRLRVHDEDEDELTSPSDAGSLMSELREANRKAAELEANSRLPELPAGEAVELEGDVRQRVELPAEEKYLEMAAGTRVAELEGSMRVHELPG